MPNGTSSASNALHDERRRTERQAHVSEAFLSSPTGGSRLKVSSIDLSRHGIGLSLGKPIASGTYHVLELGMGPQRMVSEVRILSCHPNEDGTFSVHAAFC